MSRANGNCSTEMQRNTYAVDTGTDFYTVNRVCWSEAVVSYGREARPISWEVIRADVPYTLVEITGNWRDSGYVLVNGKIKVYRHRDYLRCVG